MNAETIVKSKTHAISYIRFSSVNQGSPAGGDSHRRQLERTQEYCKKNNLILNETRYEDLGVSGWTGKNIERGRLGDLIVALKAGKIETKNTVLILENLDRFSRLPPRVAYNKLAEIIELGLDVITLEDGKIHTQKTIDDFATIICSFAVMQRAHEESTRKSDFTRQNWAQKRKLAIAGKEVLTKNCPSWLKLKADKTGFEPIPERVKLVKRIIKLVQEGKGKREIARMLDAEKVPTWSWAKCWRDNYILELVKSRALLGELQLQQRKEQPGEVIKNYYPAVIDEATWVAIQPKAIKTFNAGPQSDANNLFTGLLFDGYHPDFPMKFFLTNKEKNYVYLSSDYATVDPLYLERQKAIDRGEKPGPRPLSGSSIHYNDFEKHFLGFMADIDLAEALPETPAAESARIALLENEKKENDTALANLLKALEGGKQSAMVWDQITMRETKSRRLAKELAAVMEQDRRAQYIRDSFEAEGRRVMELLVAEGREARMSLRALFHRVIDRIEIYSHGLQELPDTLKEIKLNGFSVKEVIWRGRAGVMCYSVKLVGSSRRIWIWWDGTRLWEEGEGKPAELGGFTSLKNKSKAEINASFQGWMEEVERWKKSKPVTPDGGGLERKK